MNPIYWPIDSIDSADWTMYSTCRGILPKVEHFKILDLVGSIETPENESARSAAINDGLWDLYCHQYTTYPASPLALNYLLNGISDKKFFPNADIAIFTAIMKQTGQDEIQFTEHELWLNRIGKLPIYLIKDLFSKHLAVSNKILHDFRDDLNDL